MTLQVNVGDEFGLWRVIEKAPNKGRRTAWLAECKCGTQRVVLSQAFRDGTSLSCGCKAMRDLAAGNVTHGMTDSPEYAVYQAAVARCTNPKNRQYRNYGGRGIRFHGEWLGPDGFQRFIECVGRRPSDKHELDRYPDNNGNYEPGNVRWATRQEQCRNTRRNRIVRYDGRDWCVIELAEHLGINRNTIIKRLNSGFPIDRVVAPVATRPAVGT